MTITTDAPTAAGDTPVRRLADRPEQRRRGEGQWALGHREPLNPNERMKQDDDGLNARLRIEHVYAQRGFASIDPQDLRGRFRWLGLYTQRKPGIDGGRTAILEPHELDDEYFMLRIRIDGGQLDLAQLRAVANVSTRYGRDTADLTDRQNVQMHWIRIEDVPAIWREIEAVGLSTTEACGDTPRVVLGSPVAGIAAAEVIDATPAINEITDALRRRRRVLQPAAQVQDVDRLAARPAVRGQRHRRSSASYTRSTAPASTSGSAAACPPTRCSRSGSVPGCRWPRSRTSGPASIGIFRDYGYRRLRSRARLKFLVADWGIGALPRGAGDRIPASDADRRPGVGAAGQAGRPHRRPPAARRQRLRRRRAGRRPGQRHRCSTKVADIVEAHGSGRVRLTAQQKLIVLDVAPERAESLVDALDAIGLSARPSTWRRSTMACTGIEFCKLAIVETKAARAHR